MPQAPEPEKGPEESVQEILRSIVFFPAIPLAGLCALIACSVLLFRRGAPPPARLTPAIIGCALAPLGIAAFRAVRLVVALFSAMALTGSGGVGSMAAGLAEARAVDFFGALAFLLVIATGLAAIGSSPGENQNPAEEAAAPAPGGFAELLALAALAGLCAGFLLLQTFWLVALPMQVVFPVPVTVAGAIETSRNGPTIAVVAARMSRNVVTQHVLSVTALLFSAVLLVLGARQTGRDPLPRRLVAASIALLSILGAGAAVSLLYTGRQLQVLHDIAITGHVPGAPAQQALPAAGPPKPLRVEGQIEPPVLVRRVEADYPAEARRANAHGPIVLDAIVTERGDVEGITVRQGGDSSLEIAAMAALSQWKYKPARLHGEAVRVTITVPIEFQRD